MARWQGARRAGLLAGLAAVAGLAVVLAGCMTVAETGRQQLILVPAEQLRLAAEQTFSELREQLQEVRDGPQAEMVARVGARLTRVVPPPPHGDGYRFVLFQKDEANAFALPNGDVGIFTSLFDIVHTDDELAAVLGHEIAHVTARHAAERVSQQLLASLGLAAVASASRDEDVTRAVAALAGIGMLLPFSRLQESEADRIGQLYMARACYDPAAAIAVWKRFAAEGKARAPTFLSTHPNAARRAERLAQWLPQAEAERARLCR